MIQRTIAGSLLVLAVWTAPNPGVWLEGQDGRLTLPQPVSAADEPTTWRYTRFGWEDSAKWRALPNPRPEPVPGIHPVAWAGMLCLGVLVLLVWASSEDELGGMLPGLVFHAGRKPAGNSPPE